MSSVLTGEWSLLHGVQNGFSWIGEFIIGCLPLPSLTQTAEQKLALRQPNALSQTILIMMGTWTLTHSKGQSYLIGIHQILKPNCRQLIAFLGVLLRILYLFQETSTTHTPPGLICSTNVRKLSAIAISECKKYGQSTQNHCLHSMLESMSVFRTKLVQNHEGGTKRGSLWR